MSNKFKDMGQTTKHTIFFDDIMNIKNFNLNKIKKDGKSYKNILIYQIGYMTIKDQKYLKISSANLL